MCLWRAESIIIDSQGSLPQLYHMQSSQPPREVGTICVPELEGETEAQRGLKTCP